MVMNKCGMLCGKNSNEAIFVGFKKPSMFLCGWKYERRDKRTRKKQKGEVTEQQRLCSTLKARKAFLNYSNKGAEMQNRHGERCLSYWPKKGTSTFQFWPDTKPNLKSTKSTSNF